MKYLLYVRQVVPSQPSVDRSRKFLNVLKFRSPVGTPCVTSGDLQVLLATYKMPPKNNLKVVLVGDSGVGKSTILSRFRGERFNPCYVQTREREIKNVQVQLSRGKTVELQVWDTPGADQCRTITAAYVREDVKGVIVVFDVTNDESYFNVQHWVRTVKEYTGDDSISVVFVGNKADKGRKVREESGNQLAEQYNGVYFETSAKTNQNINEVFISIAKRLTRSSNEERVPAADVSSIIEEKPNRGICAIL